MFGLCLGLTLKHKKKFRSFYRLFVKNLKSDINYLKLNNNLIKFKYYSLIIKLHIMYKNKKVIAVIPARKNSKEIKKKNLIKLNGLPLISYTIDYAKKSKLIDRVFVSTDGEKIATVSSKFGAEIIMRPKNLSNDVIMPDHAVVHAIDYVHKVLNYEFDYVVFLQPTTPLRKIGELDDAIKLCITKKFETVFSSIDYKPFLWRKKKTFYLSSIRRSIKKKEKTNNK